MIAIIPARAGSKGLPNKNIKLFNSKPLIQWTFEAAKQSKYLDRIILTTDSVEIAKLAYDNKIEVPEMRPSHLAQDTSLVNDTFKYLIGKLEQNFGEKIEEIVVLQPTSPLRLSSDIDKAIELYRSKKADSVISYTASSRPIEWYRYLQADNLIPKRVNESLGNRQIKETAYYPNGAIYIIKSDLILTDKWYSENSYAYIMPRNRSVDIDTQEDFEYAEYLFKINL
jgi:N-acylneuraminate cytidylyltransferase/CMP-N,N'-diacetyllegionaminic acid synthase